MVTEALRGYLSLATGQVSALAEDLVSTSKRNRESMLLLVAHEVEQAVRRLGLASAADVEQLTRRVRQLERTVRELQAHAAAPADRAGS